MINAVNVHGESYYEVAIQRAGKLRLGRFMNIESAKWVEDTLSPVEDVWAAVYGLTVAQATLMPVATNIWRYRRTTPVCVSGNPEFNYEWRSSLFVATQEELPAMIEWYHSIYNGKPAKRPKNSLLLVWSKDNEPRAYKRVGIGALRKATYDGTDKCVGPCKCRIEPDGTCPNGWESRLMTQGFI